MKKRSAVVSAVTAAVFAVLVAASPASAVTYTVTLSDFHAGDTCTTPWCDGSASFVKNGDHLLVWDNRSDGHSAVVKYIRSDDSSGQHVVWNYYGVNHRLDIHMDLPESGWIDYEICLGEHATKTINLSSCSGWVIEDAS